MVEIVKVKEAIGANKRVIFPLEPEKPQLFTRRVEEAVRIRNHRFIAQNILATSYIKRHTETHRHNHTDRLN